jgi:hypothetical protein
VEDVGVGHAQERGIISPTRTSVSSSRSMLDEVVMVERTVVGKKYRVCKDFE